MFLLFSGLCIFWNNEKFNFKYLSPISLLMIFEKCNYRATTEVKT